MWRLFVGLILFGIGIIISIPRVRPWLDYDFILAWYGILFLLDFTSYKLSKFSLFSNVPNLLLLLFSSACFWWFYEAVNLFIRNWIYPTKSLYEPLEFGVMATIAFATILPFLMLISTNVRSIFFRGKISWKTSAIKRSYLIFLGLLFLALNVFVPIYTFPLVWLILFLIFDPFNFRRRSLVVQLFKGNLKPIIILGASGIPAGLIWEIVNFIIPKWQYPITPWFWTLPPPITTKLIEMPLAGYLGYIPFILSAFAFVEFLGLGKNWLKN